MQQQLAVLLLVLLAVTATHGFTVPAAFRNPTSLSGAGTPIIEMPVSDGEPVESAIRRFKREVNKSGHLIELRHKRYFENGQEKAKRKVVQARNRRRLERMNKRRMQRT